jgi:hypothetical protein
LPISSIIVHENASAIGLRENSTLRLVLVLLLLEFTKYNTEYRALSPFAFLIYHRETIDEHLPVNLNKISIVLPQ